MSSDYFNQSCNKHGDPENPDFKFLCPDCNLKESQDKVIEKLKAENDKLRECVKFYANKDNWCFEISESGDYCYSVARWDDESGDGLETCGGKLARRTLNEIGGS